MPISILEQPAVAVAATVLAIWQLAVAWRSLRRTTLAAPLFWLVVAVAAQALCVGLHSNDRTTNLYLAFSAAVLLTTPGLAVLGAKRPQSTAWQLIVAAWVGVMLMPVGRGLMLQSEPDVPMLVRVLIVGVLAVGLFNYLPTSYRLATVPAAAAFAASFAPWLFGEGALPSRQSAVWSLIGINAALLIALLIARRRPVAPPGIRRLWIDFRDAYGAAWALRVLERLNLTTNKPPTSCELRWSGQLDVPGDVDGSRVNREIEVERALKSLLRRFLSRDWIAHRQSTDD